MSSIRAARQAAASARPSMSTSAASTSQNTATRRLAQIGQHMMASSSAKKDASHGHALEVRMMQWSNWLSLVDADDGGILLFSTQATVLFESNLSSRTYKLNRPKKLNSLNRDMVSLLRPKIDVGWMEDIAGVPRHQSFLTVNYHRKQAWAESDLCKVIIGTGGTRPFCAGGDVAGECGFLRCCCYCPC